MSLKESVLKLIKPVALLPDGFVSSAQERKQKEIVKATGTIWLSSIILYTFWYMRTFVVSAKLGVGPDMDALGIAFSIPQMISGVIAGVMQTILVTMLPAMKIHGNDRLQLFRNGISFWLLLILILLSLAQALCAPWLAEWMAGGFDLTQLDLTSHLIRLLSPMTLFAGAFGIANAFLISEKRFWGAVLPAISSAVPAVLVWWLSQSLGVASLALGLTLGWGTQAAVCLFFVVRKGWHPRFDWLCSWCDLKQAIRHGAPLLVAAFAWNSLPIIDRAMADNLPTGSIAALGYADNLFSMIVNLLSAMQLAAFPFFSDQAARAEKDALRRDLLDTLTLTFFLTLPTTALLIAYGTPMVRMLLGHGLFDENATVATSHILATYSFSLSIMLTGNLIVRILNVFHDNITIAITGFFHPIVKMFLNLLFLPLIGVAGFAFSFLGMTCITTTVILNRVNKHIGSLMERSFLLSFIKLLLALISMIFSIMLLQYTPEIKWFIKAAISAGCYISICFILKIDIIYYIFSKIIQPSMRMFITKYSK